MIEDWIASLGGWTWWIVGFVLLALELVVPGVFLMWLGLAAILIGLSALFVDWPWEAQVVGFVILSLVLAVIGRRLTSSTQQGEALTTRGATRLRGRTAVLTAAIEQGYGQAKIDDTIWRVRGPDLPVGTPVRIDGVEGTILQVSEAPGAGSGDAGA